MRNKDMLLIIVKAKLESFKKRVYFNGAETNELSRYVSFAK